MLQVSKYVKYGIIAIVVIVILVVSISAVVSVNKNGYDIDEIRPTKVIETESTITTEPSVDVGKLLDDSKQGDTPDSEYAVVRALIVLANSPMSKDVKDAYYSVKQMGNDWVVEFACDGYKLYVSCDNTYFTPYKYTCSREFSKEEKGYFRSLGTVWEVENEDGTYTLYFT